METYDKKSYDKKSRLSIFDLWTPELNNLDLKIGFLIQNCIYSQLEIRKIQTLAPKIAISVETDVSCEFVFRSLQGNTPRV